MSVEPVFSILKLHLREMLLILIIMN
uniref:Uncharacterized protein n=1 Tax=Lepeophtheirus salmonis TaxID=72036 RepID=A0A0K2V862_LEPSM